MKFTIEDFATKLPMPATEKWKDGVWDIEAFQKNGVKLVFFAPRGVDYQTFHDEDEFYFILQGSGKIVIGARVFDFSAGDAFFVAAKAPHNFEQFTENFAAWAVFF